MITHQPPHRMLRSLIVPGSLFILVACLCIGPATWGDPTSTLSPAASPSTDPVSSTAPPVPIPDESTPSQILDDLASAQILARDRYDLARRFLGASTLSAAPVTPEPYEVGGTAEFWVQNGDTDENFRITAELIYLTEHVAMWVEQGVSYDKAMLIAAADRFEQKTYPTNHLYFGSESSPGIDGDIRLHILNSAQLGSSVLGYFYSPSQYPASIVPYSNECEIFYMSTNAFGWGEDYYGGVLAHEFQHMISWNVDQNEDGWMGEGLSELAAFLNGFGPSQHAPSFFMNPDLQLNTWPDGGSGGPHYGASFLFAAYFAERYGPDAVRMLVADPANGLDAVDNTLKQIDPETDANKFFGDWVIANLLRDPNVPPGIYAYPGSADLFPPGIAQEYNVYPVLPTTFDVHQYGADYINLRGPANLRIRFEGMSQTSILSTNTADTDGDPATTDSFVWWSNRGDDSDMTLTHAVDLTSVSQAQLDFDVWYFLEEGWDYGYVEVSVDDGQTWTILRGRYATDDNPQGNSYGPGYTGRSSAQMDANAEGWLRETVDLSAYAGRQILLRFETITDDAVNQPGMAVDNICVAAVNFCDDVESGPGGWETQGFVRHNNILPQYFSVQVVLPGDDGSATVLTFPLDADNRGELTIVVDDRQPAILVVSGLTRYTTQMATYQIEIEPVSP